ncbi:8-oxo-dGTP pyrophosphatase MutT (NUDIX family) [Sphingomonas zeicaulis]|uniref:NUDIX hydrolase n=1 Tax=Sphingomonas zeicaulis TaxID=1632740 RepID=UPI003D196342
MLRSVDQSAAIPYRVQADGQTELMLVTSRTRGHWIVPKGRVTTGSPAHQSAAREAFEEAGVIGDVTSHPIGRYHERKAGGDGERIALVVRAFPLRVVEELDTWPEMDIRKRRWFPLDEAVKAIRNPGLRALLVELVERQRRRSR